MISRLAGIVLDKIPPELLLDVNGVGYEVTVSMQTYYKVPDIGQKLNLFTHFVVREDAQLLYGFYEVRERTLFRRLIKVNGVGPKSAIALLSSIAPDDFVSCIQTNDINSLLSLPGSGKKTAESWV